MVSYKNKEISLSLYEDLHLIFPFIFRFCITLFRFYCDVATHEVIP